MAMLIYQSIVKIEFGLNKNSLSLIYLILSY